MENEIWKPINGFEGRYDISNFGRVKSLRRITLRNGKYPFTQKEIIMTPIDNGRGYFQVILRNNGIKARTIHQLVAEHFLNHTPCGYKFVVNHKDFNRKNNHVDNLEIVTARENTNQKHLKSSSKYTGVSWHSITKKWRSHIVHNGKLILLGYFINEIDASNAYQKALNGITNKN